MCHLFGSASQKHLGYTIDTSIWANKVAARVSAALRALHYDTRRRPNVLTPTFNPFSLERAEAKRGFWLIKDTMSM